MGTTFYSSRNSDIYANTSYSGADMIATINIPASGNISGGQFVIGDLQTLSYSLHMERGSVRALGNINVKDYTNGPRTVAGSLVFAVFDKHIIYKFKEVLNKNGEYLADELPPFDVTISFASEYGHRSVLRIFGIRLINEGEVMSVNDIYTENTYQYVARNLEYMKSVSDLFEEEIEDTAETFQNNVTTHVVSDTDVSTHLILLNVVGQSDANDGIVNFTIRNYQTTDYDLIIKDTQSKRSYYYHLNTSTLPFSCALKAGDYVASLMPFGSKETVIDEINFNISYITETKNLKGFYINNALHNTITGERIDTSIAEIYYTNGEEVRSKKIDERGYFELTRLEAQAPYTLYGKTLNRTVTPTLSVTTKIGKIELFEQFKQYILANRENLLKNYISEFDSLYKKALTCFEKANYTYSLTRSFYEVAHTPAAHYFTFLANRYEMNLYASTRELHFYLYRLYTHEFFIEMNLEALAIYDSAKKKIKTINSTQLITEKGFYHYTLTQKAGLYTLVFYFKNQTESHLEYYVLDEEVMSVLINDITRQKRLFEDKMDIYYWTYKNAIQATSSADEIDIFTKLFVLNHQTYNHSIICTLQNKSETDTVFHLDRSFSTEQPKYLVFAGTVTEQLALPAIKFPILQDVCTVSHSDYGIISGQYYYYYIENEKGQIISDVNLFNTAFSDDLSALYKKLFVQDYAKKYQKDYKEYFESALVNDCTTIHEIFKISLETICNLNDSRTKDKLVTQCFTAYFDYLFNAPITFAPQISCDYSKQGTKHCLFKIHANGYVYDKMFYRFYDATGTCVTSSSYSKADITMNCDLTQVQYIVYYYYINQQYSQCRVCNLLTGELYV